jgi:hypothetical protein
MELMVQKYTCKGWDCSVWRQLTLSSCLVDNWHWQWIYQVWWRVGLWWSCTKSTWNKWVPAKYEWHRDWKASLYSNQLTMWIDHLLASSNISSSYGFIFLFFFANKLWFSRHTAQFFRPYFLTIQKENGSEIWCLFDLSWTSKKYIKRHISVLF